MPRALSLFLLIASPVAISALLALLGLFVHAVGRGFGSQRAPTAIILATLGVALLHAGYYLAPLLWHQGRSTLALWLMTPVGVVALLLIVATLARILPAATESASNVRWFYGMLAGCIVAAAAYVTPIVVIASHR